MKNVSTNFKRQLHYGNRKYLAFADVTLEDGTQFNFTNSDICMGGFSVEQAISDDNSFTALGSTIIGSASLILSNINDRLTQYVFLNATVVLWVGLSINSTTETIKLGTYRVDDAVYVGSTIRLSLLDYMEQFDRTYTTNIQYPATLNTILMDACTQCGVTLASVDFPHKSLSIANIPLSEGTTFREVISWIAAIAGCYAKCDAEGRLVLDWFDTSVLDQEIDLTVDEPDVNNLGYHYLHRLTHINNIGIDDTVITGVSIVIDNEEEPDEIGIFSDNSGDNTVIIDVQKNTTTYTVGVDGYVIKIEGNEFITTDNAVRIINWLATQLIRFRFRKVDIKIINNPTIEVGDVAKVVNKGKVYNTLITRSNFSIGQSQDIVCGAETPLKNSATKYSSATKSFLKSKKLLRQEQTLREQQLASLTSQLASKSGMYTTVESATGGGNTYYMHNKPTLAESSVVWKMTSSAWGVTTNYNHAHPEQTTWNGGMTVDGDTITRILSAVGVSADWIESGEFIVKDEQGNETFYVNCDTGIVRINATSFSLTGSTIQQISQEVVNSVEVGGRNLVLNSAEERTRTLTSDSFSSTMLSQWLVSDFGIPYLSEQGTVLTVSVEYEITGNTSTTSSVTVLVDGTNSSNIVNYGSKYYDEIESGNISGVFKRSFILNKRQATNTPKRVNFRVESVSTGTVIKAKRVKLELGNIATTWTPAPEDLENGIDNAVTTANNANATAQQALDVASSAGGLVAYLDNDYQAIPTDANGDYTVFPNCTSQITVFYNSSDVSAQCTYTTSVSTGITGNWDSTTRTYTVTGLSVDSGAISITAEYNSLSITKKFSVVKVKQGVPGTAGSDGTDGRGITSIDEYYAKSSSDSVAPTVWNTSIVLPTESEPFLWNFNRILYSDNTTEDSSPIVIGNYAKDGDDGNSGRGIYTITEYYGLSSSTETEPTTWSETMLTTTTTDKYLWNYETILYTDGTSQNTTKRIIGTHGDTGTSARNYFLDVTPKSIKVGENLAFTPNSITVNAYYRDGDSSTQTAYYGYIAIQACVDNMWSASLVDINATSYTFTVVLDTEATVARRSGTTFYLPASTSALRVQLKSTSSSTVYLDQQEIISLTDISSLTQEVVFNKLTNNGSWQGLFLENGKMYLNAEYIKSKTVLADLMIGGKLILGGANNGNGLLQVQDSSGTTKVTLNNEGIKAFAGQIGNWKIVNNTIRREESDTVGNVLLQAPTANVQNVLAIGAPWNNSSKTTDWSSAPFRVTKTGAMYSTKGYIGGWEITTNSIRNATKGSSENTLLGAGTNYPISVGATWENSESNPNWGGSVFHVKKTGHLTAKSADIMGSFTTSGDRQQSIMMQNGIIYGKQSGSECGFIDMSAEYSSALGGNKNIAIKSNYALLLQGANNITMEVPAQSERVWVTSSGLTAQELHAQNGYTGKITFPVSINPNDGTLLEWIDLTVVDGIIQNH